MAINVANEFENLGAGAQPTQPTQPQAGSVPPQPELTQPRQAESAAYFSQAHQPLGLLGARERNVPYNQTSGKINAFLETFKEVAGGFQMLQRNKNGWEFLLFDGETYQTRISAILYVLKDADNRVAVWPWLVEDSMSASIEDRQVNIPNMGTVSIPQLPEQLMTSDPTVPKRILEMVKLRYPGASVSLVGGLVLPNSLDPSKKEDLSRCLFYANDALETAFAVLRGDNSARISLRNLRPEEVLTIRQNFLPDVKVTTATGIPVRTDASVKLYLSNHSPNRQQSIGELSESAVSTAHMFPVLMYDTENTLPPQPVFNQYGQPVWTTPPCFQTYMVINSLDNQFAGATLESQLLTLSTITSLTVNDAWKNVFKPNMKIMQEGMDPRDIGALTLDVNPKDPQNLGYTRVKDANADFNAYLNEFIKPTVIFQLDVAELGDLTYLQRAFLEAAGVAGADKAAKARAAIIDAANYLTDGKFANYFNPAEEIVFNQVGRIEKGHFVNEKGELTSIEEIDYLYLLNRVSDVNVARNYMDSLNPNVGDPIVRFARRRTIYDTYFAGQGLTITGYATRLTLNSNFLTALGAALAEAGGRPAIQTLYNQAETVVRGYHNQVQGIGAHNVASVYSVGGYGAVNQPGQVNWYNYQPLGTGHYGYTIR